LGPTSGLDVRYGYVTISVDLDRKSATFVPGTLVVADQALLFPAGGAPTLGSQTIFEAVRKNMKDDKRVTVTFIHGFSNSFTDAVERAGWILVSSGLDANMFVFTWPSVASPIGVPLPYTDYTHARATAAASGPAVARTIRRLYDFVDKLQREERCQQSI